MSRLTEITYTDEVRTVFGKPRTVRVPSYTRTTPFPGTYVLTESLSEFHIDTDGRWYRLAALSVRWQEFAGPSTWSTIRIGENVYGTDTATGNAWRTGVVIAVNHISD